MSFYTLQKRLKTRKKAKEIFSPGNCEFYHIIAYGNNSKSLSLEVIVTMNDKKVILIALFQFKICVWVEWSHFGEKFSAALQRAEQTTQAKGKDQTQKSKEFK
jgi:hypothetical protein